MIMTTSTRHHMGMLNAIKLGLSNEARERMQSDVSGMSDIISVWTADERTAGGKRNSR